MKPTADDLSAPGLPLAGGAGSAVALERDADGLALAFRPIADLRRGDLVSFEALLGADGAQPGSPAEWSAYGSAEDAGVVEACVLDVLLRSRASLPPRGTMLVTVSAAALVTAPAQEALAAAGALDDVLLCVTAGDVSDEFAVAAAVEAARDMGLRMAVDAGVAGEPELDRAVRVRPEVIRIDARLVDGIADGLARSAAVTGAVSLARRIEAEVLATDVAREADLRALSPLGVAYAMGPIVGTPATEMRSPGPAVEALVAAIAHRGVAAQPAIARLVESPIALPADTPLPDLVDTLLVDARNEYLALVDEAHRPVALVERAAVLRAEPYERAVLWVLPDAPAAPAARRAMERPPLERFAPLVCCDAAGRYIGLVRIERLVSALAR